MNRYEIRYGQVLVAAGLLPVDAKAGVVFSADLEMGGCPVGGEEAEEGIGGEGRAKGADGGGGELELELAALGLATVSLRQRRRLSRPSTDSGQRPGPGAW